MKRKAPRIDTLRVLYALSGNECAYPDCDHPIFNDQGLYIANLCHIEGASEGGPRFNKTQLDEERNGIGNLVFMCHRHHKETDETKKFTTEVLKSIKKNHEARFSESGKLATKEMIRQVYFEINYFWNKLNDKKFKFPGLKIERDFDQDIIALFDELETHITTVRNYCDIVASSDSNKVLFQDLKSLFDKVDLDFKLIYKIDHHENPFISRNWELHNIGRPNYFSHLYLCVHQLKVKVIESILKSHPDNSDIKKQLEIARKIFQKTYNNSYYVD
jgi:hypothetical protein